MSWDGDNLSQLDCDLVSILCCGWNHGGDGLDHNLHENAQFNNKFIKIIIIFLVDYIIQLVYAPIKF